MSILIRRGESEFHPAFQRQKRRIAAICLWTFSVLALAGVLAGYFVHRFKVEQELGMPQTQAFEAKLVSESGLVLVCKPGRNEWQEVKSGARLEEGDLIRTDSSGTASIVDSDGATVVIQENTIYTVRKASGGTMEVTASPQMATIKRNASPGAADSRNGMDGTIKTQPDNLRPSIQLQRIIQFGRNLEIVGYVEAGNKVVINGEGVEISGDGSFKHFTNPFPASASEVTLVMRVTNLAGQTRILRTRYLFSSPRGEN